MNVTVTTDSLQTKALEIAERISIRDFKASSGSVCKFVKRNKHTSKRINGEAGFVDSSILEDFKASLDSKLTVYDDQNIYNYDETGHMYKQSSRRTYTFLDEDKANRKFSKERIIVLFAVSRTEEMLKPLIIGKSKTPRCFKNVDINSQTTYY
ncbi:Tigger transposable element-derived protein 4 [Nosema granulosis]|uniref:Tigger transposable element-derived protein 4 n=1 Tax=Nosema granulosis TaxID=83296 RepID=A0A9P6GWN6_9MICR|nr:Tigger transposable element-derived protein 4 [Nosema granulosis]